MTKKHFIIIQSAEIQERPAILILTKSKMSDMNKILQTK